MTSGAKCNWTRRSRRNFANLGRSRLLTQLAVGFACANLCVMNAVLSPIVSEFETEEQETSYNQWFKAKVEEALHSEKPRLPHDAAMAKVQAMLEERRKARANRSLV